MPRTIHLCQDIRGALNNYTKRQLARMFKRDDGSKPTGDEVRDYLMYQLAMGRRVLPIGPCEGFSYETGCPGHETGTVMAEIPSHERHASPDPEESL